MICTYPKSLDAKPARTIDLQIQTTLDETPNTRFVRALGVWIVKEQDAGASQDRMARSLRTAGPYQSGPLQGAEPGQFCYHAGSSTTASEVFVRENVLVVLHCSGPNGMRKPPYGRGYGVGERTSVPGLCSEFTAELALRIDRLIRDQLGER